jgi:hypothetical protein
MKKRQFRSNQGRDPKKENETYKLIELAVILATITIIITLLWQ